MQKEKDKRQFGLKLKEESITTFEKEKLKKENMQLRKKIEQLREVEINSDKTKEQIAEEILEMKENILKFREERKRIEKAMEGMDKEGKLMVLENDTMEGYVMALIEDKVKRKQEQSEMKQKILQLQVEIEEKREEVSGKEAEIGVLLKMGQEKEKRIEELRKDVREAKNLQIKLRKDLKLKEREFVEKVGMIQGEIEDLRSDHEETEAENHKMILKIGRLEEEEEYRERLFDRILEKSSLIMSRRLQSLEKTVFMSKIGQKNDWKFRKEESVRAIKEIEKGKFREISGVVEYLSLGRVSKESGVWAELLREDRMEFLKLASKMLCSSASEAVLKNKMKEIKEENDILKTKNLQSKWLKKSIAKAEELIHGVVERVEQKKVFSKGWKDQLDGISERLIKIETEIKKWNRPVKQKVGNFNIGNFFKNLNMIRELNSLKTPLSKEEVSEPRKFQVIHQEEDDKIGDNVRKLIDNKRIPEKGDLIGELKDLKFKRRGNMNVQLQDIELKQLLMIAENSNQELLSENKRIKVVFKIKITTGSIKANIKTYVSKF
jgi:hypothetical protein